MLKAFQRDAIEKRNVVRGTEMLKTPRPHLFLLVILATAMLPRIASSQEVDSVSPDGLRFYSCKEEKNPYYGCYTYWLKSIVNGDSSGWHIGFCEERACHAGGVLWWGWRSGQLGDRVLGGFVHRDYEGPDNQSNLGDAIKLSGNNNCYQAAQRRFCMVRMNQPDK